MWVRACYDVCFQGNILFFHDKTSYHSKTAFREVLVFLQCPKNLYQRSGATCLYLKALKICDCTWWFFLCLLPNFFMTNLCKETLILVPQILRQCPRGDIITVIADFHFEIRSSPKKCAALLQVLQDLIYCTLCSVPKSMQNPDILKDADREQLPIW